MKQCKDCGQEFDKDDLSRRGLCVECGAKRMEESITQMIEKKGPIYEKYQAQHKLAMSYRRKQKE